MKFFTVIRAIEDRLPVFGEVLEPYAILDVLNSSGAGRIINYDNYYLNTDRETAKKWFNTIYNRYHDCEFIYDWEVQLAGSIEKTASLVAKKLIKMFNYYEEVYKKNLPLIKALKNEVNFFNDQIITNSKSINKSNLMPQTDVQSDNFPNTINENTNTTTMENKTNLINKIDEVNKKYNDIINIMADEFGDFFYLDFNFDY